MLLRSVLPIRLFRTYLLILLSIVFAFATQGEYASAAPQSGEAVDSSSKRSVLLRKKAKKGRLPILKGFALISSATGKRIKGYSRLKDGQQVHLGDLPDSGVELQAIIAVPRTKSVEVFVRDDGALEATKLRSTRARKNKKKFQSWKWNPSPGAVSIEGTPFTRKGLRGKRGRTKSVSVEVTGEGNPQPTASATPNPTVNETATPTPKPTESPAPSTPPKEKGWSLNNRIIYKDGDPFFPFGIYHISHYQSNKSRRLTDVQTMANMGLNMIHTPVDMSDQPLLDLCAQLGIDVAVEFNGEPENILGKFGNHSALAFLGTFDDVDQQLGNGQQRYSPAYVKSRSAEIKALAPDKLSYVSAGFPQRITPYAGQSDLIAQQAYPVPFEPLSSLTHVYLNTIAAVAPGQDQGWIANLQTFDWAGGRYPTAKEVRNMTYQALIAGTHGIIYYTFYDPGADLNTRPALITELTKLSSEVGSLRMVLLKGARTPLSTGDFQVFAAQWSYMGQLYVVVANAHQSQAKNVSLTLPANVSGPAVALFPGREASLSLSSGKLSGTLMAEDVQVYQLGLN